MRSEIALREAFVSMRKNQTRVSRKNDLGSDKVAKQDGCSTYLSSNSDIRHLGLEALHELRPFVVE